MKISFRSFFSLLIVVALVFVLSNVSTLCAPDDDPFALDYIEEELLNKRIEPLPVLSIDDESAMVDVPADHWAFKYVRHLIDIGLLGGYDDGLFHGDRPVTRYELSAVVSKLILNYNRYLRTGTLEQIDTRAIRTPALAPASPEVAEEVEFLRITRRTTIGAPAPGELNLTPKPRMTVPKTGGGMTHASPMAFETEPETETGDKEKNTKKKDEAPDKEKSSRSRSKSKKAAKDSSEKKDDKKSKSKKKSSKKSKKAKKVKLPKQLAKLEKNVDLTPKDLEILLAVIAYVEKDILKQIKKDMKKAVGEVKKIAMKNQRKIEKLEDGNQRYKITGSAYVNYSRSTYSCTYPGCECGDNDEDCQSSGSPSRSLSMSQYSKPRKLHDMTLSSTFHSTSNLVIKYQDFTSRKGDTRNFKLRSLMAGKVTFGDSFLVTNGRSIDGFNTSFSLNEYTIKAAIGTKYGDNSNYMYGASLQFSPFGEVKSMAYLSRFSSIDKSSYNGDDWGQRSSGDNGIKEPPIKNAVNSIFVRYPLPVKNTYVTAEYAHSTYYRPSFKMVFPVEELPDAYDTWDDYWDAQDFGYSTQFKTWVEIPEIKDQDDAFFVLLDYNEGPLSIFPAGYVHLGNQYVSRYLGMPGFDTDDLGVDMLPINLQSIDLFILMGHYKKLEDKYNVDFLVVKGGEAEPMFLDTSAMGTDMNAMVPFNLMARLNNRDMDTTLDMFFTSNKLTYYLSDDITISGKFDMAKGGLPLTCLDGNYTYVIDDLGEVIDSHVGNGVADCDPLSPTFDSDDLLLKIGFSQKKQTYNFFWRTSKKAELNLDYGFEDNRLSAITSVDSITTLINDTVSQGRKYWFTTSVKYRLTDISKVEFWFNKYYGRPGLTLIENDKKLKHTIGMKFSMSF